MKDVTGSTYGFLSSLFQTYVILIQELLRNTDIPSEFRYLLIVVYSVIFISILLLLFSFLKFFITLVARGVAVFFAYFSAALDNPRSVAYIAVLVLVQTVPWYFTLLLSILGFCGLAALITDSQVWTESFKYIMGATVGSLIGVVKKQEQIEVESRLFGILEQEATKAAASNTPPLSTSSVPSSSENPQAVRNDRA